MGKVSHHTISIMGYKLSKGVVTPNLHKISRKLKRWEYFLTHSMWPVYPDTETGPQYNKTKQNKTIDPCSS